MFTLSDFHSSGANIMMGDRSVRLLKDSVRLPTVSGLGSRPQGEIISTGSY
jgi:hypothetical protein